MPAAWLLYARGVFLHTAFRGSLTLGPTLRRSRTKNMYAIVETGGKQYRVQPGDTLAVERLAGEPGETLDLERVLLVGGGESQPRVGAPGIDGAIVRAEVVDHIRGEKIIVFRYKSKVRYRRKTGHRQALTRLRITDILLDGDSTLSHAHAQPVQRPAESTPPATQSQEVGQVPPETTPDPDNEGSSTEALTTRGT